MSKQIPTLFLVMLFSITAAFTAFADNSKTTSAYTCAGVTISATSEGVRVQGPSIRKIEYANHNNWQFQPWCNNCGGNSYRALPAGTYRIKVFRSDWSVCSKDVTVSGGGGGESNCDGLNFLSTESGISVNGNSIKTITYRFSNSDAINIWCDNNCNQGNFLTLRPGTYEIRVYRNNGTSCVRTIVVAGSGGGSSNCDGLTFESNRSGIRIRGNSIRYIQYARYSTFTTYCSNNCGQNNFITLPPGSYRVVVARLDGTFCERTLIVESSGGGPSECEGLTIESTATEIHITGSNIRSVSYGFVNSDALTNFCNNNCGQNVRIPVRQGSYRIIILRSNGTRCNRNINVNGNPCGNCTGFSPVCGVDGNSYENACKARCVGVEIAYEGECQTGTTCNYLNSNPADPCDPLYVETALYRYKNANFIVKQPDPNIPDLGRVVIRCSDGSTLCAESPFAGVSCSWFFSEARKIQVLARRADCPTQGGTSRCEGLNLFGVGNTLTITGNNIRAIQYASHRDWQYRLACNNNCPNPFRITLYGTHRIVVTRTDWTVCERDIAFPSGNLTDSSSGRSADFTNFEAYQANRQVELEWVTNSTYRSMGFVLEKSTNGTDFEVLKEVSADDISFDPVYFKEKDQKPTLGENYYRLKQLYSDDTFEYSEVRNIDFGIDLTAFKVFPNPSSKEVFINIASHIGKEGRLHISNQYGRVMEDIQLSDMKEKLLRLDLANYENGLYFIKLKIGTNYLPTQKFVVSKMY